MISITNVRRQTIVFPDPATVAKDAGQKLRFVREFLRLSYRDVEKASQVLAQRHGNGEFILHISRLFEIEQGGVVPTIYRLHCLCAIYKLDIPEVLTWYSVDAGSIMEDSKALDVPLELGPFHSEAPTTPFPQPLRHSAKTQPAP